MGQAADLQYQWRPTWWPSRLGLRPMVPLSAQLIIIPLSGLSPLLDTPVRQASSQFHPGKTVGPICRTVSDAVYVQDAIVGFDPIDSQATEEASMFILDGGYKQFLNEDGLAGKRLGVVRSPFCESYGGEYTAIPAFEAHLNILRERGETIVDNLEIEDVDMITSPRKSGETTALLAEFKLNINEYLRELTSSPARSLANIIAFEKNNPDLEKTDEYGQLIFMESELTNGIGEEERTALEKLANLSCDGFEKLMTENELDATVTLGLEMSSVLAIGGYPAITVPAGYEENGMPFDICFGGLKGTEPKPIEVAYGFEQATMIRRPPA